MRNDPNDMKLLRFCDLQREYRDRVREITEILESPISAADFCNGEQVRGFEREFAAYHALPYCSGVSSGTDALFLAMKAMGIGEGDEVIVPANTFVSTALAVCYCRATPVFCDCDADTWEMDVSSAERCLSPRTKAVVPVHLYGQSCEMDRVLRFARAAGLAVIEDCAQAHGALYKGQKVGTFSDAACFSFYPTKNLGAIGDAGAMVTPHAFVKERVDSLRNLAPGEETGDHTEIGYNMRMDSLQAAVLRHKLPRLDAVAARRTEIAHAYLRGIDNPRIHMQTVAADCVSVWNLFCVCVDDRDRFLQYMRRQQILCGVHYAIPCHLQGAFRALGYARGDLPNSEALCAHCVSLPMFPSMDETDITRVVEACSRYGD